MFELSLQVQMAKNAISAEQLEAILSSVFSQTIPEMMAKILDKFETQMDRLDARVEASLDEKLEKNSW